MPSVTVPANWPTIPMHRALIGMTQSGYTAFMLSSYRPKAPLYIFSKEKTLLAQLSLSWGVRAFYYAEEESLDDIIFDQINILRERGFLKSGDVVINTGSTPVELHLPTNIVKVTTCRIVQSWEFGVKNRSFKSTSTPNSNFLNTNYK